MKRHSKGSPGHLILRLTCFHLCDNKVTSYSKLDLRCGSCHKTETQSNSEKVNLIDVDLYKISQKVGIMLFCWKGIRFCGLLLKII